MTKARVSAHLIVGRREEPFLGALLESLAGVVDFVIVNDNGPEPSAHGAILNESWHGRNGRLIVDTSPFVDFSTARNRCLEVHAKEDGGDWVAFVDADEVHGTHVAAIAANLANVPATYDFVDGYTWHFFQSFDLYASIERRMAFFRYTPAVRWTGKVHEQLTGLSGKRLALPYVYGHYGHVLPARWHAEKGRQYSSLGQSGPIVGEGSLDSIDVAEYFKEFWPIVMRFTGHHPAAARPTIQRLRADYADAQRRAMALARAAQPPLQRARNLLMKANYEQRWRSRALNPFARRIMSA
ncbi:MAG TPA: hypothetical protein VGR69_07070 [Candidatus Rubrimentiphilum sp.]|nr:hypothetical protein [Candidatus Rubrimentiphilum sp.]